MALRQSAEDYLETILIIKNKKGVVHSVDVANHLNFSKPSVSRAVSNLRRDGYLEMLENGELILTPLGANVAEHVYERHTVISAMLISLGVSEETALEDACNMEHVISEETFQQFKNIYQKRLEQQK
ncbi:MAG: metal-dependent transcriptional regulator [Oscillospiraceae bacterium]